MIAHVPKLTEYDDKWQMIRAIPFLSCRTDLIGPVLSRKKLGSIDRILTLGTYSQIWVRTHFRVISDFPDLSNEKASQLRHYRIIASVVVIILFVYTKGVSY